MEERIDIHGLERRLRLAEESLRRSSTLSERNCKLISEFAEHAKARGLSESRVSKCIQSLSKLGEWLGKDFDKASREDIRELMVKLETSDYSPWSKHTFRAVLKRFYKWLLGNDEEYPEQVKWIKTTLREKDRLLPKDLLTEEEVRKLVEAADNPRDRAFIMLLYETGGRIGEVGSLRVRDIEFKREYASVILRGKTGSRRVPVVASVPYLLTWLDHHPLAGERDAPLWVKFSDSRPMTYPALAKVLRVASERAKLGKRVHPHTLRHSRATFLASKLTEAQMCALFGWKQGSDMPGTYVHLSGRDLDQAILGIYGLRRPAEERSVKLAPRECPRCRRPNPATNRFCSQCGMALDMEAVMELEEKRREADELMTRLLEDPEVRKVIRRKLARITSALA